MTLNRARQQEEQKVKMIIDCLSVRYNYSKQNLQLDSWQIIYLKS